MLPDTKAVVYVFNAAQTAVNPWFLVGYIVLNLVHIGCFSAKNIL